MKSNKDKQALGPANSKIILIEQFVQSIDREMETLAEQLQAWKEEKKQWDQSSTTYMQTLQQKIRTQIRDIENQLKKRQAHCLSNIQKINQKLVSIQTMTKQTAHKVSDLKRRVEAIQQLLGTS